MRVAIVGAGPAGATVAEVLRQEGFEGDISLFSEEPFPPYSPPAMVEYFLTGREIHFWKGRDFAQRWGIRWFPGTRVVSLDVKRRRVVTARGEEVAYDRAVLAQGARLNAPIPGAAKPGVSNFKSLSAAEEVVARARSGAARRAVIVGAGFIGVEVALLLRQFGVAVTQVEMMGQVMPRILDPEAAVVVAEILEERGVDLRLGTRATAFIGEPRAEAVELGDGQILPAEILVAATGVRPNLECLRETGVKTRWGILVDDTLRTNVSGVYAAGDVAETVDRVTGESYVHAVFPNAVAQAAVVAQNLLGREVRYPGSDQVNSLKHLGIPIVAVGSQNGDEVLRRGRGRELRKLFLEKGRLVGFQMVGDIAGAGVLGSLLSRQIDVGPLRPWLLEPSFGVGTLAGLAATSALGERR
jgi:NAD(P)H-nitrite reductase large subunit